MLLLLSFSEVGKDVNSSTAACIQPALQMDEYFHHGFLPVRVVRIHIERKLPLFCLGITGVYQTNMSHTALFLFDSLTSWATLSKSIGPKKYLLSKWWTTLPWIAKKKTTFSREGPNKYSNRIYCCRQSWWMFLSWQPEGGRLEHLCT